MSADNFNLVRKSGSRWNVWTNLSASCDRESQTTRSPNRVFDELEEAVKWADEQGYTEYGTEIDDESDFIGADDVRHLIRQELALLVEPIAVEIVRLAQENAQETARRRFKSGPFDNKSMSENRLAMRILDVVLAALRPGYQQTKQGGDD